MTKHTEEDYSIRKLDFNIFLMRENDLQHLQMPAQVEEFIPA